MMSAPNTRQPRAARDKSQKSNGDSSKVADGTPLKIQPTAEQIRLAQMINDTKDTDDPDLQNKIKQVMELTGKSSDDASVALHDCDNDPNRAINMLLEGEAHQGEWETSIKRKKSRPATLPTNAEAPSGGSTNNKENRGRLERGKEREGKDRDGNRNRGPPRMNRGKGRDSEKNERNLEDSRSRERSSDRRGRGSRIINGPGRAGRGRGGGRIRTFQNRGASHSEFPRSIDTWTNVPAENADGGDPPLSVGNWSDGFPTAEDWDNEDWTGSLAETKVFTPSTPAVNTDYNSTNLPLQTPVSHQSFVDGTAALPPSPSPPREPTGMPNSLPPVRQVQSVSTVSFGQNNGPSELLPHTSSVVSSSPTLSKANTFSLNSSNTSTDTSLASAPLLTGSSSIGAIQVAPKMSSLPSSNSLAAALGSASRSLNTTIPTSSSHQQQQQQQPPPPPLPVRPKSQKPRTLATSKIPSSAVEMPEDAIAALDVQFGSLEFGSESSTLNFNSLLETAASIQTSVTSTSGISNHISSIVGSQAPPPSSLSSSVLQMSGTSLSKTTSELGNVDQGARTSYPASTSSIVINKDLGQMGSTSQQSVPQVPTAEYVTSASTTDRKAAVPFSVQRTAPSSVLDGPLPGSQPNDSALSTYSVQNNNVNNHSNFQSTYASHKAAASFSHHHSTLAPPVTQNQSVSLYGSSASSQSQTSVTFPTVTPSSSVYGTSQSQNSFSNQNQSSVYVNPVATVSTYASGSSISQTGYGSHSHSSLHSSTVASSKLASSLGTVKDTLEATSTQHAYDASHTTSAPCLTSTLTTASSGTSSLGLSSGVLTSSNMTAAKSSISNSKTGIPSLPPGVPAVLSHQYIMSQTGLPFYCAQQPMYTYEDLQLLQQRMPPMASYYDMAFQPSTTLTGRDGGLANVAYTGTDGKFSRGDNSSPVPTTLSQQQSSTQQHQQTFISPTAIPHGYSYYYPGGVVASGFTQYGTPIFNVPPATNAHGATTSTHFPKPNAYGSHAYTSGYESLGQNQDYGKTSYGSSSQNQAKAGTGSASSVSGNDLASSVYSKTHSQMNKSYDKPGFHAGTPPPFNLAGTQTGQLGAPSTAYAAAPFIPMMAQHPSPMLHHQLHQDSSSTSQRPTPTQSQSKTTSTIKQGYSSSNYWASA